MVCACRVQNRDDDERPLEEKKAVAPKFEF